VSELTVFLDQCGIEFIEKTGRLSMLCPFHDDTDPSSGFYTDTELFHCFACSLTLSPDRFYAKLREISIQEARKTTDRIWTNERKAEPLDLTELLRMRSKGEALLQAKRGLGYKDHARVAEELDLILMSYERGISSLDKTKKGYEAWEKATDQESCASTRLKEEIF